MTDSVHKSYKNMVLPSCIKTVYEHTKVTPSNGTTPPKKDKIHRYKCECRHCKTSNTINNIWTKGDEMKIISHLLNHSTVNRGFFMFSCPLCEEFETLLPSIPSDIYYHINRYHKDWIIKNNLKMNSFFPIMYCRDCNELTTFQHKHCFSCPKQSGGYIYFKNKKELNNHLTTCHPIPNKKSNLLTNTRLKRPSMGAM